MHALPDTRSQYDRALNAESNGKFAEALELFQLCITLPEYDEGDVLFHCGWCAEQVDRSDNERALRYYEHAAFRATAPECKLNSFFRAGWLLMQRKEHAKAAVHFMNAIDYAELSQQRDELYHNAMFWHAVCLEPLGRYIEAIEWHRLIRTLDPRLDPESRVREICCLNQIASYEEAFSLCETFDHPPPPAFSATRYLDLREVVSRERDILNRCLSHRSP